MTPTAPRARPVTHRRRRRPQAARRRGRRAGRRHGRPRPRSSSEPVTGPGGGRRRPAGRSGRRSTPACSSWSRRTAPRSSSSTPAAWPSAWPPGSTSCTHEGEQPGGRGRGHLAAGRGRERAGQGPPRLAVPRAAAADRGRAQDRPARGAWSPRPASSSASTWARSTSSSRSSRPGAVSRGLQRIGRAGHQVGEPSRGKVFPKHRGDLVEAAVVVAAHARRAHRVAPATPATRSTCWPSRSWPCAPSTTGKVDELAGAGAPGGALRRAVRRGARRRARPAGRPLPVRGVRRAAAPHRVGPGRRRRAGPGRAPSGWPSPAAAPSPTAACSACSCPTAPGWASSTRRWSTRAGSGETFLLGRHDLAHRGDHPRPGRRHPGARAAGQDAVLARRRPGPPARAGPGARRVRPRAAGACRRRGARHGCASVHGLDELAAANLVAYLDEQAEATGAVPDDRTIVVERFRDEIGDWRVCVLSPFGAQVHAPWAMALQPRLAERGASTSS